MTAYDVYLQFTAFLFKVISYIIAPILYHISTDSYVATFLFNILELTDTLALYLIFMIFVSAILLVRNYVYSLNKGGKVSGAHTGEEVRNDIKLLTNSTASNSKRFSQLTHSFISIFTKKS